MRESVMLGGVACVSCHVICHAITRVDVCMRSRVYARMDMLVRVHVHVHGVRACTRVCVCVRSAWGSQSCWVVCHVPHVM